LKYGGGGGLHVPRNIARIFVWQLLEKSPCANNRLFIYTYIHIRFYRQGFLGIYTIILGVPPRKKSLRNADKHYAWQLGFLNRRSGAWDANAVSKIRLLLWVHCTITIHILKICFTTVRLRFLYLRGRGRGRHITDQHKLSHTGTPNDIILTRLISWQIFLVSWRVVYILLCVCLCGLVRACGREKERETGFFFWLDSASKLIGVRNASRMKLTKENYST
jgi:hypothetical protein